MSYDLYAGYVVEDSDLEYSGCSDEGSSDDDCDGGCSIIDNQTCKRSSQDQVSSEDEFEKEMASEVLSALKVMVTPSATSLKVKRQKFIGGNSATSLSDPFPGEASKDIQPEYYDEVYFDSDSDEDKETEVELEGRQSDEEGAGVVGRIRLGNCTKKVRKLTNEELFYDPTMDEKDEKWINRCRMAYHNVELSRQLKEMKNHSKKEPPRDAKNKVARTKGEADKPYLPKSDAILNCPACMVTLSLDCQRHDIYVNQYRAMFVLNCCVLKNEVLKYIPRQSKRSRKRHRVNRSTEAVVAPQNNSEETIDSYHPVRCSECNTEVAVMDSDEVFHFFNVLASAPS